MADAGSDAGHARLEPRHDVELNEGLKPGAAQPAPPARAPPTAAKSEPTPVPAGGQGLAARPPAKQDPEPPVAEIDLFDQPTFKPTGALATALDQSTHKPVPVKARFGKLSSGGIIHVIQQGKGDAKRWSIDRTRDSIPLDHPFLKPIESVDPVLVLKFEKNGDIAGQASLRSLHSCEELFTNKKYAEALGLVGVHIPKLALKNELKGGHLTLGTKGPVSASIGEWLTVALEVTLQDTDVTLTANGDVKVKGATGTFHLERNAKGEITGSGDVAVALGKTASGQGKAIYRNGNVDVEGVLKFSSEKFSGSITLLFGDASELQEKALQQVDPQTLVPEPADAKKPAAHAKKGDRGLAGWGEVDFAFTEWFTGKAKIIIDPVGYLTVVGKIAPPKTFTLMDEKVWNQHLFGIGITARYGLPYVADIHVGISVDLGATARIGPAVLTEIEVEGQYSTNPQVANAFSISGAFRLSAYAGLTLRFEGKAGLTILKHDIDVGAGITGTAGVKGYAEARPTIGYREKADPQAGKKGEYYLKGHLEIAAQPFLGLAGDLFVKLDSPWWSPAPDKTWTWDLFSLEYPLPGEFGLGADVDYVIGSGQMPKIEFGKASFDASKFTDSLMDDNIPKKTVGGDVSKPAKWQGEPVTPPPAAPPQPATQKAPPPGKQAPTKGTPKAGSSKGKQSPEESANVPKTPDAAKRWLEGLEALGKLHDKAEKEPEDDANIVHDLGAIKQHFGFTVLTAEAEGDYWLIDAEMNPKGKPKSAAGKKKALRAKKKKGAKAAPSAKDKKATEEAKAASGGDETVLDKKVLEKIAAADRSIRRRVLAIGPAFEESTGEGGAATRKLGATTQSKTGEVIEEVVRDRASIREEIELGTRKGKRVLDFLIDVDGILNIIEVKYQLHKSGKQFERMIAQMKAALSHRERWNKIVLVSYKPPSPEAVEAVRKKLGDQASAITIVGGLEELAKLVDEMVQS